MNLESHEGIVQLKEFVSRFKVELGFTTVSIVLIFAALMVFLHLKNIETTPSITVSAVTERKQPQKKPKTLFVHLDGAVEKPDVYEVTEGARLKDILVMANGLSKAADRTFFSQNFNLAQILADQQKIYIPAEGEVEAKQLVSMPNQASEHSSIVSINTASQAGLEELPAIGPVTAQKIISGRPYSQVDELISRKIVGPATFEKLKPLISL